MIRLKKYEHTIYASYLGYITQAICNNFAPLLFLTFSGEFALTLDKITLITTINYLVQLTVDLLSVKFIDRIGYRISIIAAHVFATAGLVGFAVFPSLFGNEYAGIMTAVVLYAIGGGIIEVLISPIVEACPTRKKEAAMSLWASAFAESALHVSKMVGDLAGPCAFAVLMGSARAGYGNNSDRIPLKKMMAASACLCILCYLLAGLSKNPVWGLLGCAVCGFSVGIFWPGTFSLAAMKLPTAGTAMYAFMALAGDVGCSAGPTLVGMVANAKHNNLQAGLLLALIFPVMILVGMWMLREKK